ncbi:MAG: hypothetical protein RL406_605 [Pseudomonadota bacterium]|jgi:hypothetical protein
MNTADFITTIWNLLLARPQLLADHMRGYAALMRDETELAMAYLRYRLSLWVAWVICALVFLGLLGVSVMLWATTPNASQVHGWVFIAVPTIPLTGLVMTWIALNRPPPQPLWDVLQKQIAADMALLSPHVN